MKCKIFDYFSPFIREIGWVYFFLPNELGVKRLYQDFKYIRDVWSKDVFDANETGGSEKFCGDVYKYGQIQKSIFLHRDNVKILDKRIEVTKEKETKGKLIAITFYTNIGRIFFFFFRQNQTVYIFIIHVCNDYNNDNRSR